MGAGLWRWPTCDSLLNFTWWNKNRRSFLWLYLCLPSPANQPHFKVCIHSYLFPFPVSHQTHNATEYDSAISKRHLSVDHPPRWSVLPQISTHHFCCPVYRGFWSIFMLIGVAAVVLGGFVIICAAPFTSPRLYKAGGGLFLVSGTAKAAHLLLSGAPTLMEDMRLLSCVHGSL